MISIVVDGKRLHSWTRIRRPFEDYWVCDSCGAKIFGTLHSSESYPSRAAECVWDIEEDCNISLMKMVINS